MTAYWRGSIMQTEKHLMTDNEEVAGGGQAGWNLTCIPGIICGAGAKTGLLVQLSRPQLKHLAHSLAEQCLLCGKERKHTGGEYWCGHWTWICQERYTFLKHHHLNEQHLSQDWIVCSTAPSRFHHHTQFFLYSKSYKNTLNSPQFEIMLCLM